MGKKGGGGGGALNIFSIFYTHHRIPNKHMMTINFDTITNNYEVIYVIKTVMKYHLKKIDTSFHQPLPNMVQRLFADVINDAIWFMNIHEQNHPGFLAMSRVKSTSLCSYSLKMRVIIGEAADTNFIIHVMVLSDRVRTHERALWPLHHRCDLFSKDHRCSCKRQNGNKSAVPLLN